MMPACCPPCSARCPATAPEPHATPLQADAECPHHAAAHAYLDRHTPHDTPTYRTGADGRVQVAQPAPRGSARQQLWAAQQRAAAGRSGPDTSALHDLCAEFGVADRAAFVRAVHRLPVERQHALFEHAGGVADLLQARPGGGGCPEGLGKQHAQRSRAVRGSAQLACPAASAPSCAARKAMHGMA